MSIIFLESKDNPKIKHLRGLIEQNSYRKKQQQTNREQLAAGCAYKRTESSFEESASLPLLDLGGGLTGTSTSSSSSSQSATG